MNAFERLEDFESQTIHMIAFNMVKWLGFDGVEIKYQHRSNVESTVWIDVKIEEGNNTYWIDGQRNDIVKRRLVDWLKSHLERARNNHKTPNT